MSNWEDKWITHVRRVDDGADLFIVYDEAYQVLAVVESLKAAYAELADYSAYLENGSGT